MARLITSGAEVQDLPTTTGTTVDGAKRDSTAGVALAVSTTIKRSGNASWNGFASNTQYAQPYFSATPSGSTVYLRAAFYIDNTNAFANAYDAEVCGAGQGANINGYAVRWEPSTQEFSLYRKSGTAAGTKIAGKVCPVGKWWIIQLMQTYGTGSVDAAELRINGRVVATDSGANAGIDSWGAANFPFGFAGLLAAAGTTNCYVDDIAINDTSGTDENSWPNLNGKVVLALPVADKVRGGTAPWTGGVGGTTNLFDAINNTPPIGTATETDLTQVEHPGNGGTSDQYLFDLTTPANLGMALGTRLLSSIVVTSGFGASQFGTSSQLKAGQRFVAPTSALLKHLAVALGKNGSAHTDDLRVSIQTESAGVPSGTMVWSTTVAPASLSSSTVTFDFYPMVSLTPATNYWIVVDRTGAADAVNNYWIGSPISAAPWAGTGAYPTDFATSSHNSTSWSAAITMNANMAFWLDWRKGDLPLVQQLLVVTGEDIATGTKLVSAGASPALAAGASGSSTPGAGKFVQSGDVSQGTNGALGTFPTGWWAWRELPTYSPDFNSEYGLIGQLIRPETASRVASVCFFGLTIEYVERKAPPPIVLHRPNNRVWRRRVA